MTRLSHSVTADFKASSSGANSHSRRFELLGSTCSVTLSCFYSASACGGADIRSIAVRES